MSTSELVELRTRRTALAASALANLLLGASVELGGEELRREGAMFLRQRERIRRLGCAFELEEDAVCGIDGDGLASPLEEAVRDLDGLALMIGEGLNAGSRLGVPELGALAWHCPRGACSPTAPRKGRFVRVVLVFRGRLAQGSRGARLVFGGVMREVSGWRTELPRQCRTTS